VTWRWLSRISKHFCGEPFLNLWFELINPLDILFVLLLILCHRCDMVLSMSEKLEKVEKYLLNITWTIKIETREYSLIHRKDLNPWGWGLEETTLFSLCCRVKIVPRRCYFYTRQGRQQCPGMKKLNQSYVNKFIAFQTRLATFNNRQSHSPPSLPPTKRPKRLRKQQVDLK